MAVFVLLDAADAFAVPDRAQELVALTPAAFAAARSRDSSASRTSAHMTDYGHARCVAAANRALAQFDTAAASNDLRESVRLLARQSAWQLAVLSQRLARTLPAGPNWVRNRQGNWVEAGTPYDAQEALLPRIFDWGLAHRTDARRAIFPGLHAALLTLAARRSRRNRQWIVTTSRKLKLGLDREVRNAGATIGNLGVTRGGWPDYARALRTLVRGGAAFDVSPVAEDDTLLAQVMVLLHETSQQFSDPLVRGAWRLYTPYLEANCANAIAVLRKAPKLMKALGARLAVTYEANSWLAAALLEAAQCSGGTSVVVNHNSHARTGSATADSVLGFLFHQRTANSVVDLSAQWSPHWKEWVEGASRPRYLAFRARYPEPAPPRARFRILHAGNYQNWSDFIPWIAETSNEYVAGLATLAGTMAVFPDMELVIRVRTKTEVNPGIVQQALPQAPNVVVCDTSEDFLEQLAACDLLVSHFSTTVEQALQLGKPVLLWGSVRRYCQVPPSRMPPSKNVRAAVYVATDKAALERILPAIREYHWRRPLSADEVAAYRNAPGDPDLPSMAVGLLSGS